MKRRIISILFVITLAIIAIGPPAAMRAQGPLPPISENAINATTAAAFNIAPSVLPSISRPAKNVSALQDQLAQMSAAAKSGEAAKLNSFSASQFVDLANKQVRIVLEMDADPDAHVARAPTIETVELSGGKTAQIQHAPAIAIRPALAQAIVATGATYETAFQNLVQVLAPFTSLEALAKISGVRYVRLPYPAEPSALPPQNPKGLAPMIGSQTSEGVNLTQTNTWHSVGYKGSGVALAVFDFGFTGWAARQGTGDLPAGAILKDFSASYNFSPDTSDNEHGTACAEITFDMAPEATHYLYAFGTDVEFGNAVGDFIGVSGSKKVVSMSIGWANAGPYDGTGPINAIVDNAQANGIFWANSAGNNQKSHWSGTSVQYSTGDSVAFGADSFQGIGPSVGNYWNIPNGTSLQFFLEWNDWNAARTGNLNHIDYDMYLLRWNGSSWVAVTWATGNQCGSAIPPTEAISHIATGGNYVLVIQRYTESGCPNNFGHWMQLHTFLSAGGDNLFWHTNECNSLLIPGDGDSAVTVGAAFWNEDSSGPLYGLEPFSSLGPRNGSGGTDPGATVNKPDVVAPDGTSGVTYGASNGTNYVSNGPGFWGTSAAAPHVAGMAAVLWSGRPAFTLAQVRSNIQAYALEKGDGGGCGGGTNLNNRYGNGRINFGSPSAETLAKFNAKYAPKKNATRLRWTTGNELQSVGFNVYRAGAKAKKWTRLNDKMISAQFIGQPRGAKYLFADHKVKAGRVYAYKLELVLSDGSSQWSEVVQVQVR